MTYRAQSVSPLVAIVIVNWNGFENTVECLESLKKLQYREHFVILVDNASSDQSEIKLRRRYPEHTLIQSGSNLGFAGGANLGIRDALARRADYVLLLNNDIKADSALLDELVKTSESESGIGITGGRIDYMSPPGKAWACGAAFNVNTGCAKHFSSERELERFVREAPWFLYVPGCVALLRRECIEDVGLLSEKYFHLAEDVEYCVRAQQRGWKVAIAAKAMVSHKSSASLGRFSPLYNYYEQRNRLFVIKQYRMARGSVYLKLKDGVILLSRVLLTLATVDRAGHFLRSAGLLALAVYDFFCDQDGKREDDSRYHTISSL